MDEIKYLEQIEKQLRDLLSQVCDRKAQLKRERVFIDARPGQPRLNVAVNLLPDAAPLPETDTHLACNQ